MAESKDLSTDWKRSAGDFICSECGRKRLTAAAFSKNQVTKALKSETKTAKCKECVAGGNQSTTNQTKQETAVAAPAPASTKIDWYTALIEAGEPLKCSNCEKGLSNMVILFFFKKIQNFDKKKIYQNNIQKNFQNNK